MSATFQVVVEEMTEMRFEIVAEDNLRLLFEIRHIICNKCGQLHLGTSTGLCENGLASVDISAHLLVVVPSYYSVKNLNVLLRMLSKKYTDSLRKWL